jgi:arabinogalactan endo-1,4-beta-galactosidase
MMMRPCLILAVFIFSASVPAGSPLAGTDLSDLAFFEQRGVIYRENGEALDAFSILKRQGLTCVRLRLFTSSAAQAQADPYNYGNNLDYTLPLARRVKVAGFKLILDFHFSDTWADPAHQLVPSAWTNLSFVQLVQQMRIYCSNTIASFRTQNAMPDYVQIGNEISSGLLWPLGRVGGAYDTPTQWSQLGQLLKSAAQGIKDASGTQMPGIIVHIDRGGDWPSTEWFFDNINLQGVAFDVIGETYYPFWQGSLESLANCLTNAANRYGKPVLIAETAFPWTNTVWTTNIVNIAPGSAGQVAYFAALASVYNHLSSDLRAGIVWWGAEYQNVTGINDAGFNTTSFFDAGGYVLPIARAMGSYAEPLTLTVSQTNDMFALHWPMSGSGAILTATTNLNARAVWSNVEGGVETNAAGFDARSAISSGENRFFRLQMP